MWRRLSPKALGILMASSDSGEPSAPRSEVRRRTRCKTAPGKASTRGRSGDDIGEERTQRPKRGGPPPSICHLCETSLNAGESSTAGPQKTFKGFGFHGHCHNAVRAHRRLYNGAALQEVDLRMSTTPSAWRQEVAPLIVSDPGGLRDNSARRSAKQRVMMQQHYDKSEHISDTILYTKRRYKAYTMFWEQKTESEASSDFEDLFVRQGGRYGSDSERVVAVKDNERIRKIHGASTIVQDDITPTPMPNLMEDNNRGDSIDSFRRRGGRDGRRSDRPRRRDQANAASESSATMRAIRRETTSIDGSGDDIDFRRHRPPTTSPHACVTKATDSDDSPCGSPVRKRTRPASVADDSSKKKSSIVEFMERKAQLRDRLKKSVETVNMKTGVLQKLTSSLAKLDPRRMNQVEGDPRGAIKRIEDARKVIRRLIDDMDDLKSTGWHDFYDNSEAALTSLDKAIDHGSEELQAVRFLIGDKAKEVKSINNSVRYKRSRLVERLMRNGYGEVMASHLVAKLEGDLSFPVNRDYDAGDVQMWVQNDEAQPTHSVHKSVLAFVQKCGDINSRKECLIETLTAKASWKGAMSIIDAPAQQFSDFGLGVEGENVHGEGSMPWLVAARVASWRYGPFAWPLPGYGCFVAARGPETTKHLLMVMPAKLLLNQGIALQDAAAFFETASGTSLMKDVCRVVEVAGDSIVWVPYGHLAIPLALPRDCDEKLRKFRGDEQAYNAYMAKQLGFWWVWTAFSAHLASQVEEGTWRAIQLWNAECMERNKSNRAWTKRLELTTHFSRQVVAPTSS